MSNPTSLDQLRVEIDQVDDAIHDLIMRRAEIVEQIRILKPEGQPKIHPNREAVIVRRLLERHHGKSPLSTIVNIWRQLIGSSTGLQGGFSVGVPPSLLMLAQKYYGDTIEFNILSNQDNLIERVLSNDRIAGILPWPSPQEMWWLGLSKLPAAPKICATLPFLYKTNAQRAVLIAKIEPQPTGDDRSWLVVNDKHTDFEGTVLAQSGRARLIEVEGFISPGDPRLGKSGKCVLLGAFATPQLLTT